MNIIQHVKIEQFEMLVSLIPQVDPKTKIPRNAVWGMVFFAMLLGCVAVAVFRGKTWPCCVNM